MIVMKKNIAMLFMFVFALCGCGQNTMIINGVVDPGEGEKFQYAIARDKGGNTLDSVAVVDNKFTLNIPCESEPYFANVKVIRKKGIRNFDAIVHPCVAEYKEVPSNSLSGKAYFLFDNGGYNDKVFNNWWLSDEMTDKFSKFLSYRVANTKEYFSDDTPMDRKMEIYAIYDSLSKAAKGVEDTHLMSIFEQEDIYYKAFAISVMKVNDYNYKYVPEVVSKLGHIDWVAKLGESYDRYITRKGREAKIAIGERALDISGNDINGKSLKLSDIYSSNKITILYFLSADFTSKEVFPILKEIYPELNAKGCEIYSVWCDSEEQLEKFTEEHGNFDWKVITKIDGNLDDIEHHYMSDGSTMLSIDSNGIIVGHDTHRYRIKNEIAKLLNK